MARARTRERERERRQRRARADAKAAKDQPPPPPHARAHSTLDQTATGRAEYKWQRWGTAPLWGRHPQRSLTLLTFIPAYLFRHASQVGRPCAIVRDCFASRAHTGWRPTLKLCPLRLWRAGGGRRGWRRHASREKFATRAAHSAHDRVGTRALSLSLFWRSIEPPLTQHSVPHSAAGACRASPRSLSAAPRLRAPKIDARIKGAIHTPSRLLLCPRLRAPAQATPTCVTPTPPSTAAKSTRALSPRALAGARAPRVMDWRC